MNARARALLGVLMVLAMGLAACTPGDGQVVRAVFDDVADLTVRGVVKIADVPVGTIGAIELTDDNRAMVTMDVRGDLALPSRMTAELRKTAVLGERYVQLVPDHESGGTWESGGLVAETRFVPELEELVGAGSELLAAVAVDKLGAAIEAGAIGLEGRGETLNQLLNDLTAIVGAYDANSADLVRLIDGFDAFLAPTGPQAGLHERALVELTRAFDVLAQEDERLLDALAEVRDLAVTGTDIMRTHRARFDRFFSGWRSISDELVSRGEDLDLLFSQVAKHNHNTIRGVNLEHAQVLLDFIVCGENDEPNDPVRTCLDPPQGRPRPDVAPPRGSSS